MMAQIKKADLEVLTNDQLKDFFAQEDWKNLPEPILSYVKGGEAHYGVGMRLNRVQALICEIIVDRLKIFILFV